MKNNLIKNITLGAVLFVPGTTIINNIDALADDSIDFIKTPEVKTAVAAAESAVSTAESTPSTTNISIARDLVNKLPEGPDKERLQGRLNAIIDITDITMPILTTTANVDIYIKCENMLSLSLSTNNVTFEDHSGVEDDEKENAVTLTINSSLPYDVNAYLPTNIEGSRGDQMDINTLQIRANGKPDYKNFPSVGTNPGDKVELLADEVAGNNKTHGIDLKLQGGLSNPADIYKANIKFEVVQK